MCPAAYNKPAWPQVPCKPLPPGLVCPVPQPHLPHLPLSSLPPSLPAPSRSPSCSAGTWAPCCRSMRAAQQPTGRPRTVQSTWSPRSRCAARRRRRAPPPPTRSSTCRWGRQWAERQGERAVGLGLTATLQPAWTANPALVLTLHGIEPSPPPTPACRTSLPSRLRRSCSRRR